MEHSLPWFEEALPLYHLHTLHCQVESIWKSNLTQHLDKHFWAGYSLTESVENI